MLLSFHVRLVLFVVVVVVAAVSAVVGECRTMTFCCLPLFLLLHLISCQTLLFTFPPTLFHLIPVLAPAPVECVCVRREAALLRSWTAISS